MIPSALAAQMSQGLADYLRTTFPVSNPFFIAGGKTPLDRLIEEPGGVLKGPYISLAMPFLTAEDGAEPFPELPMGYPPYRHQSQAFERLRHPNPQSSLIATGTGSGKTECFLYPILDHCRRHQGQPGVKAIFLYPMNALGGDQANRLAALIHQHLPGRITAGLYVGGLDNDDPAKTTMGPDHLITDRHTLRSHPPDILLTNYKMLDYLLVRPEDSQLWADNAPETLRYLVVDELHTFDGAQGTDLACLLRRLQARLATPENGLCAVGTSATLGGDGGQDLIHYARDLFGCPFQPGAVIGEQRLSPGEFLNQKTVAFQTPGPEDLDRLNPANHATPLHWLETVRDLWFKTGGGPLDQPQERIQLGQQLMGHYFFQNLVRTLGGQAVVDQESLVRDMADPNLNLFQPEDQAAVVNSMLGLVAHARTTGDRPFLHLRVQLWAREMRRMVASVTHPPRMRYSDDLTETQLQQHLPLVHCRECGAMGWTALKQSHSAGLAKDLQALYRGFFANNHKLRFLFPTGPDNPPPQGAELAAQHQLCGQCLTLNPLDQKTCGKCGEPDPIQVYAPELSRVMHKKDGTSRKVADKHCPYCGAHAGMTLVGVRGAGMISTFITQAFGSRFNPEPKMLTFSDSVQDAAHRAGFFQSRTWRFNLRIAIARCLGEAEPLTLDQLTRRFMTYWRENLGLIGFVSTFIAPDMLWQEDFEILLKTGVLPKDSDLPHQVEQRLETAIAHEFSLHARIGRSLEKSGVACVAVNPDRLDRAAETLWELLINRVGSLRELTRPVVERWLDGLLEHLKNQGGVMLDLLNFYLESGGKTFVFKKIPWAPNYGPNFRRPMFLTEDRRAEFQQIKEGPRSRPWSLAWTDKVLFADQALRGRLEVEQALLTALEELTRQEILREHQRSDQRTWGLNPAVLEVRTRVFSHQCGICRHGLETAAEHPTRTGQHCLRVNCQGSYEPVETSLDYYGKLYREGQVNRVFSKEHTGLLKRAERETLEAQFRNEGPDRAPYHPNLISCTPTLEMGIDIGDLDTLALCSIPPGQAAYLQRIGRAGRRDGNALSTAMAEARPHDLYFYAQPMEMMAGAVKPPGVFLDAAAVLERQLAAFCLDRWVAEGQAEIPRQVKTVLNRMGKEEGGKFPYSFTTFVEHHGGALLQDFTALFNRNGVAMGAACLETLERFMFGDQEQGGLRYRLTDAFWTRRKERDALRNRHNGLKRMTQEREKSKVKDEAATRELEETRREARAIGGLLRHLENSHTLNLLTDAGVLPNYAFPENGVLLRSVIYRKMKKPDKDGKQYQQWVYEYQRPASGALAELAPDNQFYAGGRRVTIDQVDLKVSEVEDWRFCTQCSYSALEDKTHKTCPACGSSQWADAAQKRSMVRLRTVYANTSDRESRIGDDRDNRDNLFYKRKMLVRFSPQDRTAAWACDDPQQPFGFEFLKKCVFREVNFGRADSSGDIMVAGENVPVRGFTLCAKCGKVQDGKESHAVDCPTRKRGAKTAKELACVYLYREFASEALRILLPVTSLAGGEEKAHSFVAGLQLGLEKHFSGAIDHLRVTDHQEPTGSGEARKRFLVLYDSVPGGTGYLKQLMSDPDQLFSVLQKAVDHMKSCACATEDDKDGCYRCLFAYRTSYHMRQTSRRAALDLFGAILSGRDRVKTVESLSAVDVNPLFDSELEKLFLEALHRMNRPDRPLRLRPEMVNGKPGCFLNAGAMAWEIEPQVNLGWADGVTLNVRPDFVFRPAVRQHEVKPIAVFLDGFRFHGDKLAEDTAKRAAILDSGGYHVWSLAWDDVNQVMENKSGDFFRNYLEPENPPNQNYFAVRAQLARDMTLVDGLEGSGSLHWLAQFLADPNAEAWTNTAWLRSLLFFENRAMSGTWTRSLARASGWDAADLDGLGLDGSWFCSDWRDDERDAGLAAFALFSATALAEQDPAGVALAWKLTDRDPASDGFREAWVGYLRLMNLFQFLPNRAFLCWSGVRAGTSADLSAWRWLRGADKVPEDPAWAALKADYDHPNELAFLDACRHGGAAAPTAGYELEDGDGVVTAMAEWAWPDRKLAVLLEPEDGPEFEKAGWRWLHVLLDNVETESKSLLEMWERSA